MAHTRGECGNPVASEACSKSPWPLHCTPWAAVAVKLHGEGRSGGGRAAGPPAPQPSVGAQFSLVNHGRQSRGVLGKDNEDLHARAGGVLSSPHQNPLEGPGPGGSGNSAPVRHREWARGQRKGKSSPRARGGGGKCGTSVETTQLTSTGSHAGGDR